MIPTIWRQFYSSPLTFLGRWLYGSLIRLESRDKLRDVDDKTEDRIRLVCISDTHNTHNLLAPLPKGDILIHAGDFTEYGTYQEADAALAWIAAQKHPHKIVVAGNHEIVLMDLDKRVELLAKYPQIKFLQDASALVSVRGRVLRFYGNAQAPLHGTPAFAYPTVSPRDAHEAAARLWRHVPEHVDVLVTHGAPAYHCDYRGYGCPSLLPVIWRLRPPVHLCGHIHQGRGIERLHWTSAQAAYERICAGMGGWLDLLPIVRECVKVLVCGKETGVQETILANVASQLEWMDGINRPAMVIDI